jgi:hypothetical protein
MAEIRFDEEKPAAFCRNEKTAHDDMKNKRLNKGGLKDCS